MTKIVVNNPHWPEDSGWINAICQTELTVNDINNSEDWFLVSRVSDGNVGLVLPNEVQEILND
jgi:hypothetical protein